MRRSVRPEVESMEAKALLSGPTVTASGLAASLTAHQERTAGGIQVVLTLTETDVTNHDVNVSYGPSVDGFVATRGGRVAWVSNSGIQPDFVALETLKPGRSFTLTATWDGRSGPSGTFVVHNELDPAGPSVTVTIGATAPAKPPHRAR